MLSVNRSIQTPMDIQIRDEKKKKSKKIDRGCGTAEAQRPGDRKQEEERT